MPRYDYRCAEHGVFERLGRLDEDVAFCSCGREARRLPYSGVPHLKGATVARSIPDESYKWDALRKENRARGWDEDRAVRAMRSGLREDDQGNRYVDFKAIEAG